MYIMLQLPILYSGILAGVFSFGFVTTVLTLLKATKNTNKYVYIMRGVPGSGKTSFIQDHCPLGVPAYECNAMHFFRKPATDSNGSGSGNSKECVQYKFNPRCLPRAYNQCFFHFMNQIFNNTPLIYVNNPNIQLWEFENYIHLAKRFGYRIKIVDFYCATEDLAVYLASRNVYKIPEETCRSMYARWQDIDDMPWRPSVEVIHADIDLNELEGDSLPYPKKTREQLDEELDMYHKKAV